MDEALSITLLHQRGVSYRQALPQGDCIRVQTIASNGKTWTWRSARIRIQMPRVLQQLQYKRAFAPMGNKIWHSTYYTSS